MIPKGILFFFFFFFLCMHYCLPLLCVGISKLVCQLGSRLKIPKGMPRVDGVLETAGVPARQPMDCSARKLGEFGALLHHANKRRAKFIL